MAGVRGGGGHGHAVGVDCIVAVRDVADAVGLPAQNAVGFNGRGRGGCRFDDEEIRAALKQNGIGRPSSRASIIETLFKRGYVRRNRKTLVPTPTGQSLIGTIRSDLLKSCELTGQWERKLRLIEEGRYEPETFMEELKQQLAAVISDVKSDTASGRVCPSEKPRKPYKSRKSRKR